MTESIIDNATIHSIGNLFDRQNTRSIVREINIQSLDNFLESYVLNDFLYVDENKWNEFLKKTPEKWHKEFLEIVIPVDLVKTNILSLKDFLSNEIVFWILNLFLDNVHSKGIFDDFLSYTGQDFDNYRLDKDSSTLFEISKILKEKWNWDYNHANYEHIDSILLCYRTYEYIELANANNKNIVLHPLRNHLINLLGEAYNLSIPKQTNSDLYEKIISKIRNLQKGNIFNDIRKMQDENKIIWNSIEFPFIPAIIYEQSSTVNDIFKYAKILRKKFEPFRIIINEINTQYDNKEFKSIDENLSKINDFISNLTIENGSNKIEYCYQIGLPFSFALGITKKDNTPKYLKIFNEIKHRFNLPKSYIYSCYSLFGNIRWNENVQKE